MQRPSVVSVILMDSPLPKLIQVTPLLATRTPANKVLSPNAPPPDVMHAHWWRAENLHLNPSSSGGGWTRSSCGGAKTANGSGGGGGWITSIIFIMLELLQVVVVVVGLVPEVVLWGQNRHEHWVAGAFTRGTHRTLNKH